MNFDDAISAHLRWKMWLREFLSSGGDAQLAKGSLDRDDFCEVGRWIHREGEGLMPQDPDFLELKTIHAEFHTHVGEIVQAVEAIPQTAEVLLDGDRFTELSIGLITCLHRLKKKYPRLGDSHEVRDGDSCTPSTARQPMTHPANQAPSVRRPEA